MSVLRIALALEKAEDLGLLLPVADALAASTGADDPARPAADAKIEVVVAAMGPEARERLAAEGRAFEAPGGGDWFFEGHGFDLIIAPLAPAERGGLVRCLARDAARRGVPFLAVERDAGRPAFDPFPGYLALSGGSSFSHAVHAGWDPARIAVTGSTLFDGTRLSLPRERTASSRPALTSAAKERAFWSAELAGVARPIRILIVSAFPFAADKDREAFAEGLVSAVETLDGPRVAIAASLGGRDLSGPARALADRLREASPDALAAPADSWLERLPEADVLLTDDLRAGLLALSHGVPLLAIEWPLAPVAPGETRPPLSVGASLRLPEGWVVSPQWAGAALREALAGGRAPAAIEAGSALERVRGFVEPGPPLASERIAALALHLGGERAARRDRARERILSGNARLAEGRGGGAEAAYRQALTEDPANEAALTNLGLVLAARGADRDALDCFHRVLDLDARNVTVRLAAAQVIAEAGDPFAATRLIDEILGGPPDRRVLAAAAGLYLRAGIPERAIELLDRAAELGPLDEAERAALALALSLAGRPEPGVDAAGDAGDATATSPRPSTDGERAPRKTSIVIVTMNEIAYTRKCVASIAEHTPEPYEIVFVDNGSTDGTPKWIESLPNALVTRNDKNLGFAAAANQGIRAATGDRILLLNNDAVVTEGWLAGLTRHLERDPRVGLVGPVSNYASGPQFDPTARYESLLEMASHARRTAEERRGESEEALRLGGFCLLARAEVFRDVGHFDEKFGLGTFEDEDLCVRAVRAGWRLVVAKDVFIHHFGSRTFLGNRINYREALERNKAYFLEKWGGASAAREARAAKAKASDPRPD